MADTLVKNPKLIVGTQAQVESEMGANDIGFATDVEFYTAKQIDELLEKSGGASLPILIPMWSDHVINDMSWLRADTFSWQSGDTYKAAYEHLNSDLSNADKLYCWYGDTRFYTKSETPSVGDTVYTSTGSDTGWTIEEISSDGVVLSNDYFGARDSAYDKLLPYTDVIGDITITYYLAQDSHKICLPDQESNLIALYEKTGAAWYYIIDTTNQRFKSPRRHSQQIVRSVKNADGSWYRLYADGWVEQGGAFAAVNSAYHNKTVTLLIEMNSVGYSINVSSATSGDAYAPVISTKSSSGFTIARLVNIAAYSATWQVSGQSAIDMSSFQDGEKYLYFYVGNFEQTAVEQTAGLNTELFNGKADIDLGNLPTNIDYVVESQMPTTENGYTWYRKYKSGWVEQGCHEVSPGTSWTLPVPMANDTYTLVASYIDSSSTSTSQWQHMGIRQYSTYITPKASGVGQRIYICGMSAQ